MLLCGTPLVRVVPRTIYIPPGLLIAVPHIARSVAETAIKVGAQVIFLK